MCDTLDEYQAAHIAMAVARMKKKKQAAETDKPLVKEVVAN